jgi:hypothetical protein
MVDWLSFNELPLDPLRGNVAATLRDSQELLGARDGAQCFVLTLTSLPPSELSESIESDEELI